MFALGRVGVANGLTFPRPQTISMARGSGRGCQWQCGAIMARGPLFGPQSRGPSFFIHCVPGMGRDDRARLAHNTEIGVEAPTYPAPSGVYNPLGLLCLPSPIFSSFLSLLAAPHISPSSPRTTLLASSSRLATLNLDRMRSYGRNHHTTICAPREIDKLFPLQLLSKCAQPRCVATWPPDDSTRTGHVRVR